jgi:hypothetical protein
MTRSSKAIRPVNDCRLIALVSGDWDRRRIGWLLLYASRNPVRAAYQYNVVRRTTRDAPNFRDDFILSYSASISAEISYKIESHVVAIRPYERVILDLRNV